MKRVDYEVRCLLCGAEIGSIVFGHFERHAGCSTPLPRRFGLLRCCQCGGSLYLEPIDSYRAPVSMEDLRNIGQEEPEQPKKIGRPREASRVSA
jgi:hypothetical protein